jgi:hypothetical protein
MKINGIEGKKISDLQHEVENGGKFVIYTYCFSIIVMTFKRGTDIYYIEPGKSGVTKSLPWTMISLLFGWWGLPWGLIYTPSALYNNLSGGKDVTREIMDFIYSQTNGPVFDFEKEVTPAEEKTLETLKTGIEN